MAGHGDGVVDRDGVAAPAALPKGYFAAVPMTAYNAITPVEVEANKRLVALLRGSPGGGRLEQVLWAASGSEETVMDFAQLLSIDQSTPSRHVPAPAPGWVAQIC